VLRTLLLSALVAGFTSVRAEDPTPVLYTQTFASPDSVKDFVFSDPAVWKWGKDDAGGFLELAYEKKAKPAYNPKHRSPFHIALLAPKVFTDFTLDVQLQSTTPPYGHQDMCLFFGFESPERYYYVHLARAADMNAHNVFIVNDAPRKNIARETTKGIDWKANTWHNVRLVRDTKSGKIEVYFDDMAKPVMRAEDKTFAKGRIGFGSFDDTGRVRNVRITGPSAEEPKGPPAFFKSLGK
jgi:hypothetical protein